MSRWKLWRVRHKIWGTMVDACVGQGGQRVHIDEAFTTGDTSCASARRRVSTVWISRCMYG